MLTLTYARHLNRRITDCGASIDIYLQAAEQDLVRLSFDPERLAELIVHLKGARKDCRWLAS